MDLLTGGIAFFGVWTIYEIVDGLNLGQKLIDMFDGKEKVITTEKHLVLGKDQSGKHKIIVDMGIDSHALIIGLSNCGKSKLAEGMLKDKSVTVINAFDEDFKSVKGDRIIGEENILQYLQNVLEGRTVDSKVHYLLIDEMLVLMKNKAIGKALADLLATARHYNLYIVALGQEGTKEVINCKGLFNVRICMKQIEESSFRVVLGCSVPDTQLKQREFYVLDNNGLRRGISYSLD